MSDQKEYMKQYNIKNRDRLREYQKKWRKDNPEKVKQCKKQWKRNNPEKLKKYNDNAKEYKRQWRIDNLEKMKKYMKQWYENNRETALKKSKQWRGSHPEKMKGYKKQWYENNCDKAIERSRQYCKNRYRIDPKYNLNNKIKAIIRLSLRGSKAGRKWEDLVGYTLEDLYRRLKKTIPTGYTWNDFMSGKLQIDHIIPISAFNFDCPEHTDFKRCWAVKNLRLLPTRENLKKGNKLEKPFQLALKI